MLPPFLDSFDKQLGDKPYFTGSISVRGSILGEEKENVAPLAGSQFLWGGTNHIESPKRFGVWFLIRKRRSCSAQCLEVADVAILNMFLYLTFPWCEVTQGWPASLQSFFHNGSGSSVRNCQKLIEVAKPNR